MRILFSSWPAYGHLLPMLPLARAARRAGHDDLISSGSDVTGLIEQRGFAAPRGADRRRGLHRGGGAHGPFGEHSPQDEMTTAAGRSRPGRGAAGQGSPTVPA